jgi:hypothetical protein
VSTTTDPANADNTRANRWECAVCGAIGPNAEYDSLDAHAREKHPEEYREYTEAALGIDDDVAIWPMGAAIVLGVVASVAAFAVTWNLLLATGAYVLSAIVTWTGLWVVGYA